MKINQQKVEEAVKVLETLRSEYPGGFPKEMKGDISSFGASIIQAGLLPSVLFFSEGKYSNAASNSPDEDTKTRRAKLMKVVFDVLKPETGKFAVERPLLEYVRSHLDTQTNKTIALDNITEAALAVKIALRAFAFSDNPSPESSTP